MNQPDLKNSSQEWLGGYININIGDVLKYEESIHHKVEKKEKIMRLNKKEQDIIDKIIDTKIIDTKETSDLEIQGYNIFVYPNLALIDIKCKELGLSDNVVERAKSLADEYIKRTYRRPRYSSIKHVIPAFVYIASILENDWDNRKTQFEVAKAFGTAEGTVRKWYRDVIEILDIRKDIIEKIGYDPTKQK